KFGEVPTTASEDINAGLRLNDRVALAGDGLDESRFAAAVGAENSNILSSIDAELGNEDQRLAYALLRIVVGLNLMMHGISRTLIGPGVFASKLVGQFAH